jgi:hypothetical protein
VSVVSGDLRSRRSRRPLVPPARVRFAEMVVEYWYPAAGHPDGVSDNAWFRVVDGSGYHTQHNPAGTSPAPSFRIVDDRAVPTLSMPNDTPTFEIIGLFAFRADRRHLPWFRIKRVGTESDTQPGDRI